MGEWLEGKRIFWYDEHGNRMQTEEHAEPQVKQAAEKADD